ncbi:hypothetical protein WCQ02_36045 [Paraburkholderia tropica]|nr:hypothetical protein [Paraburkholderia tropica]
MQSLPNTRAWRTVLRRAWITGGTAAAASALTAAQCARRDGATAPAPMNAVTHAIWPRAAPRELGLSARFTLTGFAIHGCASVFWAIGFEALRARRARTTVWSDAADAAAFSAAAWLVDYHVVPRRLTPGFETHMSNRSMLYVYGSIAAGFAAAAIVRRYASRG